MELLPWILMSGGYVDSEHSILLDYVSLWNVNALFKSLRNRHFLVSITVLCGLIIKLMAAASTGLFFPQAINVKYPTPLQRLGTFDSTSFNVTALSVDALVKARGILGNRLDYPPGTRDNHAFAKFRTEPESTGIVSY
jgi:hypothetical protein